MRILLLYFAIVENSERSLGVPYTFIYIIVLQIPIHDHLDSLWRYSLNPFLSAEFAQAGFRLSSIKEHALDGHTDY